MCPLVLCVEVLREPLSGRSLCQVSLRMPLLQLVLVNQAVHTLEIGKSLKK